jgi:hypothetical protein
MILNKDEFFGHDKTHKLALAMRKKAVLGFKEMVIKDKDMIKFLKSNEKWLDYIGIILVTNVKYRSQCMIKWSGLYDE